jgi:hypothetical protein
MEYAPYNPENPSIVIAESLFRRELHAGGENLAAVFRAVQTLDWARREWRLVRRMRSLDPEEWRAVETIVEAMTTAPPPSDVH